MYKKFITDTKKLLSKQDGVALMSVLIVFSVSLIILGSGSMLALNNLKASSNKKEGHSAYYLAEAGAQEFSDLMLDYLEDPSNKASLKFTNQEDLVKAINQEVYKNLRSHQEVDGKGDSKIVGEAIEVMGKEVLRNIFIQATGEVVDDSYIISSSASIGDATRTVEIKVSNILASISDKTEGGQPGAGGGTLPETGINDWSFIEDYALIFQKGVLNGTIFDGDIFFMSEVDEKNPEIKGPIEIKKPIFHTSDTKSAQEVYKRSNFKNSIKVEQIKTKVEKRKPLNIDYKKHSGKKIKLNEIKLEEFDKDEVKEFNKNCGQYCLSLDASGNMVLSLSRGEDMFFSTEDMELNGENNRMRDILYVDVGSKDVEMFIEDDFVINKASLLVIGDGSLTIHVKKIEENDFQPYFFSGISDFLKNTDDYKLQNNLTVIAEKDLYLNLNRSKQKRIFNASVISFEKLSAKSTYNELDDLSYNFIDLGPSGKKSSVEITPRTGNISTVYPIFAYIPYGKVEMEAKINGFIYTNELIDKDSTITHNPNVVKNLSKKAKEILGMGTLGGSNGDGNSDSPLNKPIIFEATRETD